MWGVGKVWNISVEHTSGVQESTGEHRQVQEGTVGLLGSIQRKLECYNPVFTVTAFYPIETPTEVAPDTIFITCGAIVRGFFTTLYMSLDLLSQPTQAPAWIPEPKARGGSNM